MPSAGESHDGVRIASGPFFAYHGVWALGVRLFRTLQFRSKALIISAVFLVPIFLLATSMWSSARTTIEAATRERAGVRVMRALVPVYQGILQVRVASRVMLGGHDAASDFRQAREQTAAAFAALEKEIAESGDPIGLSSAVSKLKSSWEIAAQSTSGIDATGHNVFIPVTESMVELLAKLGDDSNLVLDPSIDSAYLVNGLVLVLPSAAEDLAQIWSFSTYALAKHGLEEKDARRYETWSSGSAAKLAQCRAYLARAMTANPALTAKLDLAAIDGALEFRKHATSSVETGSGDVQSMYTQGAAATTGLFKVYEGGLSALDSLLAARIHIAERARNIRFLLVAGCLLLAAYLFYAFFLVTQGGLDEVRRHLVAMTGGDLTTNPNPWGADEAAALMLTLRDMQASLRKIVTRVRTASAAIVHASGEIAAASMDLSARVEQTAANLEQSSSSMQDISSTVTETAEHVRDAARVASGNSETAARGGTVVAEVVSTMQEINTSSNKIADIIGTIDGIAFQTNILALNAAVEAARAGEHGRGFAVVASEVRDLAQRSAVAAREIKTLITTSVGKVESGTHVVRGAGDTMRELVENARRINALLTEIATAASQQSARVAQVGSAVTELDGMTQQNAALVEQTAAAAATLKDQAMDLAAEVGLFKLPGLTDSSPPAPSHGGLVEHPPGGGRMAAAA